MTRTHVQRQDRKFLLEPFLPSVRRSESWKHMAPRPKRCSPAVERMRSNRFRGAGRARWQAIAAKSFLLFVWRVAGETQIYNLLQQIEPERRALRESNHCNQQ